MSYKRMPLVLKVPNVHALFGKTARTICKSGRTIYNRSLLRTFETDGTPYERNIEGLAPNYDENTGNRVFFHIPGGDSISRAYNICY